MFLVLLLVTMRFRLIYCLTRDITTTPTWLFIVMWSWLTFNIVENRIQCKSRRIRPPCIKLVFFCPFFTNTLLLVLWNTFFRDENPFGAMVSEGWEPIFGAVVLHGNMLKIRSGLFLFSSLFSESVKVKVAEKCKIANLCLQSKKRKRKPALRFWTLITYYEEQQWMPVCVSQLKLLLKTFAQCFEAFMSIDFSPVAGTTINMY